MKILIALLFLLPLICNAQFDTVDDDLNIGGDIFTDFDDDLESKKILEDERYYRYGRFYSMAFGGGYTMFFGNRGDIYQGNDPSYAFALNYFSDFHNSYGIGFEYSTHHMFLKYSTEKYKYSGTSEGAGWVDVKMLRVFFSFRHYIDTANLGTAITWANPYLTGRLEYWYVSNSFIDQDDTPDFSGGGFGFGFGGGLEFPIKIKESYIGLEVLLHSVNFHDKNTSNFAPVGDSNYGWNDLTGMGLSVITTYVISW